MRPHAFDRIVRKFVTVHQKLVPQPTMHAIAQGRFFLDVAFRSPDDDRRHPRKPSHANGTEGGGRRDILQHFRVVKKMNRLTRGPAGAVRLTWNLETSPNFLGRKAGTKITLGNDRQVGPDAKQILGVADSGRLSPFRKSVRPSSKVTNLPL